MRSSKKKRKVLITGGAGFIGSNFVRFVYDAHPSWQIFNLDLLTYAGNPENLSDIEALETKYKPHDKRYHFVQGDVNNASFVEALFSKHAFDVVINFAAETHVDRSIVSATDFLHTNVGGARTLAEAVRAHKVPRFVHISTDEVYGEVLKGTSTEESLLCPSNPYSSSKAAGDLILLAFFRTHQVPVSIVRGSNNYGPFQYPEKLIPLAISNLLEGRKIPVHGDGLHKRSWLHVNDFCRAIDLIVAKGRIGQIYNIAGEERTNMEVLHAIAQAIGVPLTSRIIHVKDRPGGDRRYAPNASKIAHELGFKNVYRFDAAIKDVVAWYTTHTSWWEKIKTRIEYLDHYERQASGKWY